MDKKHDSVFLGIKKKGDRATNGEKKSAPNQNGDRKPENSFKKKCQDNFSKNRKVDIDGEVPEKKPFDKKAYRLKKYSKKYKLEQWEEQRKKVMLHKYQKEIKNDAMTGTYKPVSFDEDTVDSSVGQFVRHPDLNEKEAEKKQQLFSKAKNRFDKVKQDKLQKQQEIEKAKEEKNKKLQEYKKKKQDRFKKLSKKTKKGQPVMTGRLELLLEKIQNNK